MKKQFTNRGFTLIELLVVIAIIGILASVVLASLNSARDKGKDAAAKSSINQARSAAEIIYSSNSNSYANICPTDAAGTATGTAQQATLISQALRGAARAYGIAPLTDVEYITGANTPGTAGYVSCNSSASTYMVQVELSNGNSFCIDSAGNAGEGASKQADATGC